jgi:hypothetical protein
MRGRLHSAANGECMVSHRLPYGFELVDALSARIEKAFAINRIFTSNHIAAASSWILL